MEQKRLEFDVEKEGHFGNMSEWIREDMVEALRASELIDILAVNVDVPTVGLT